jgi:hypothetical protein
MSDLLRKGAVWTGVWCLVTALTVLAQPSVGVCAPRLVFSDGFDSSRVSSSLWHIPTWVSPTDGTYVGRTQFRVSQSSALPTESSGAALITLETYNPTGFSLYGTDLIANPSFSSGGGLDVVVRARMDAPVRRGAVTGMFLYDLKPGSSTLHDEVDFELLGNHPDAVQTNVYANEPLGGGHPVSSTYASGTVAEYHDYEIKWTPSDVTWYVDGSRVRTETVHVPSGPMHLHLNMWAPDSGWAEAYDSSLQPTDTPAGNDVLVASVDSVRVTVINPPVPTSTRLSGASSVGLRKSLRLRGTLSPMVVSGRVTITRSHLTRGRWKPAGSSNVTAVRGRFAYAFKPTAKGRWRIVATFRGAVIGSTTYLASASAAKTVTVR